MKHVLLVSLALTLLASCTLMPEKSTTPAMQKPEIKMDSTIMEDKMMSGADMMKKEDDVMDKAMMGDKKTMDDTMVKPEAIKKDESTIAKDDDMMKKDESAMTKPTGYMNYDAAQVDAALASGQKVVLFFHATWCPSCKALDKAILADTVPSDAIIFKVDYDTSAELKKQYRVVSQHTTVVLNRDGTEKIKKLGARTVAEVMGE